MIGYLFLRYLPALLLTLVVEAGVAYIIGFRSRRELTAVAAASLVTHPILNASLLVAAHVQSASIPALSLLTLGLEGCVVVAEGVLLAYALRLGARRAAQVSLLANAASYLVGVLLGDWWPVL